MNKYLIKYTLRSGEKGTVILNTNNIFDSLFQYERNRDIKNWDLIELI
tara:strand:+ start:55 stop:198 length:144 start_codon:yes stop_codon:yes gene_type:complete